MQIAGMTVSVGYADYLAKTIHAWKNGLDRLLVVTAPDDSDTQSVCLAAGVAFITCRRFYENAYFNKAAGLNEAYARMVAEDWVIAFDADILPPADWRDRITAPEKGTLYGAERGELDAGPCGCLMLFHAQDMHARREPLFVEYNNASGYDTEFTQRWGKDIRWLPFDVKHLGKPCENWCGRGRSMSDLLKARDKHRGFAHERMPVHNVPQEVA